jgi:hypothetical protein
MVYQSITCKDLGHDSIYRIILNYLWQGHLLFLLCICVRCDNKLDIRFS